MVKRIRVYFSPVAGSPEFGGVGLVFLFKHVIVDGDSVSSSSSEFGLLSSGLSPHGHKIAAPNLDIIPIV